MDILFKTYLDTLAMNGARVGETERVGKIIDQQKYLKQYERP